MADSVIQLKCQCSNYSWGKKGHESLAARLCARTPGTDFKIDDEKEYAEMWMGTYPATPSYVLSTGENLQDVLNANKEKLIGKPVLERFGADLPFLPKILSIAKALPLQIHPDKTLAAKLHQKDPEKFSDANHKPEIAVALSTFELFVGFKPLSEIESTMLALPPLHQYLPPSYTSTDDTPTFTNSTLKSVCYAMLTADEQTVRSTQAALASYSRSEFPESQAYIHDVMPRLQAQYSAADNGTLVALCLMNFIVMEPGSAVYVPADGIHAYLSGDIVECMARSDNVLNTGFCPRADRDSAALFCDALTFAPHGIREAILDRCATSKSAEGTTTEFKPPMSEFNMLVTELDNGEKDTVKQVGGPSVMIVTSGKGVMSVGNGNANSKKVDLEEGFIFFIGQGVDIDFVTTGLEHLVVYRAYVE